MRILLNGMYFYPEVGGMEVHMLNLAIEFLRLGDRVEVVTSNSAKMGEKEVYKGILIIRTPFFGKNLLGWILTTLFSIPVFLKRSKKADIVHGHDIASILPCMIAKKFKKKPFILTLHSSHFIKLSENFIFKKYFRWGIKGADYVFAASKEIKEIANKLAPEKEVETIVNPVNTEFFSPWAKPIIRRKKGEFLLICPRRLVEKNGVQFLIEAMPKICKDKKVKLVVVGEGPLKDRIEKRIKELKIEKNVFLIGSLPNDKMPGLFVSGDLVVIPSLMEATSIAALEAMSCGKPVAASRVGGLVELIDEKVGFLMEPKNPEDIARKINLAFNNVNLLKKKGELARKKVISNWGLDKLVERHREVYLSFLKLSH
ncbi:MAG: glycosyltransferase family 4 protein [candidate division WOR-3 bacterium]